MEALLKQGRSACPFLKRTSTAALRTLSTTNRPVSPGGGAMSNLQVLARRCPVMGKAMVAQSARSTHARIGAASIGGLGSGCPSDKRTYYSKADFHTTASQKATVSETVVHKDEGRFVVARIRWLLTDDHQLQFLRNPRNRSRRATTLC